MHFFMYFILCGGVFYNTQGFLQVQEALFSSFGQLASQGRGVGVRFLTNFPCIIYRVVMYKPFLVMEEGFHFFFHFSLFFYTNLLWIIKDIPTFFVVLCKKKSPHYVNVLCKQQKPSPHQSPHPTNHVHKKKHCLLRTLPPGSSLSCVFLSPKAGI